jgi:hypothetical protein
MRPIHKTKKRGKKKMKIVAYVCKKVEMEVDDKFAELLEEENEELDNELVNIILADDDVIGVDAIWDENEEFCIGEY